MPLNIEREISYLKTMPAFKWIYLAMKKVQDNVNQLATNVGADTRILPPPPNIGGLTVKSSGTGLVHAVISDPTPELKRNIQYFLEYDTNPGFTQPQVEHMGSSRQVVLRLPGKNDASDDQSFYFRAYSQYPGSAIPSKPMVWGGPTDPTAVAPGGSDPLTLIPSTGSGTAANNGTGGGSGLGRNLHRTL